MEEDIKKRRLFISLASFLLTISIFMAVPAKQVDAATISLGSTKSYVSNGSGSFSVKVSCSGSWTVSDNAGWVSVRKSGSYVYVNYDANTSFSSRSASVTIKSGLNTKRFSFTQYANSYSMSLTKATLSAVPGSSFSVNVSVNQGSRYVSSKPSWLTYSQSGNTFTFKATENTGGTRTGTVYFYVAGQSKSISVTQNAYSLTVSNDSNKTIKSYKNTYSHYVTATTGAWTCTSDSTSWLTVSKSGNYLYVTAYQNPYSYSRSGNITFKLGGITKTIKYTQEANDFTVSTGSVTFSPRGDHTSVKVTTSGDGFTYTCNADWLTISSDKSTFISFGTDYNNTTGSKRSATITINDKHGRSKTISVYQEAHSIITDIDKIAFNASVSGKNVKVTCSYSAWSAVSNDSWINVNKYNGVATVSCTYNNTGKDRSGSITITSGGAKKTITVTQSCNVIKVVNVPSSIKRYEENGKTIFEIDASSSSYTLEFITSLNEWLGFDYYCEENNWLTLNRNENELTIKPSVNDGTCREVEINVVFNSQYPLNKVIVIRQKGVK